VLEASNAVIQQMRELLGPDFVIIGVGGIMSAKDAVSKLRAGANLVQIYSGLIYAGPSLISEVAQALKTVS
jgi:dihydroorotate dehydrogenase